MSVASRPDTGGHRPAVPPRALGGIASAEVRPWAKPGVQTERRLGRAAQYVRMSTEHQRYSTENQADAIRQYAERRGLEVIRTYADEGRSGLRLDERDGLKCLIEDVQGGKGAYR